MDNKPTKPMRERKKWGKENQQMGEGKQTNDRKEGKQNKPDGEKVHQTSLKKRGCTYLNYQNYQIQPPYFQM